MFMSVFGVTWIKMLHCCLIPLQFVHFSTVHRAIGFVKNFRTTQNRLPTSYDHAKKYENVKVIFISQTQHYNYLPASI
jgi:hypothetical protein